MSRNNPPGCLNYDRTRYYRSYRYHRIYRFIDCVRITSYLWQIIIPDKTSITIINGSEDLLAFLDGYFVDFDDDEDWLEDLGEENE